MYTNDALIKTKKDEIRELRGETRKLMSNEESFKKEIQVANGGLNTGNTIKRIYRLDKKNTKFHTNPKSFKLYNKKKWRVKIKLDLTLCKGIQGR